LSTRHVGDSSWAKDEGFLLPEAKRSQAKPSVESGLLETQDVIAEVALKLLIFLGICRDMESLVDLAASLKRQKYGSQMF